MAKKKPADSGVDAPPLSVTVEAGHQTTTTAGEPYPGFQEYPKWVGGRLVQSEAEEARVKKS